MGISTHILDTAIGRPATHVTVTLSIQRGDRWEELSISATDDNGRCGNLVPESAPLEAADYRLHFKTASYYAAQQLQGLYPFVEITFTVTNTAQHYHIPLLLTANGYTTYRGS